MFNELHHGLVVHCMHWIDNNDAAHRRDHVLNVANECVKIAEHYKLDRTRLLLAALTHDIFSGRDRKEHHTLAAQWVRDNLGRYGYDAETVACVAQMCAEHRASLRGDYSDIYCEAFSAADRGPLNLTASVVRQLGKPLKAFTEAELASRFAGVYEKLMVKFGRQGYARPNKIHDEFYRGSIRFFKAETETMERALQVVLIKRKSAWQFELEPDGEITDQYLLPSGAICEYNPHYDKFFHPEGYGFESHEVPVVQGRVQIVKGVI